MSSSKSARILGDMHYGKPKNNHFAVNGRRHAGDDRLLKQGRPSSTVGGKSSPILPICCRKAASSATSAAQALRDGCVLSPIGGCRSRSSFSDDGAGGRGAQILQPLRHSDRAAGRRHLSLRRRHSSGGRDRPSVFRRCRASWDIDLFNRTATVQAGVTNLNISVAVSADGFFYAPDPSSQLACTIGGNIGMNSGARTV